MAFLNDRVLDEGLSILQTEVLRIDICSSEPTDYTQATSTYSLGSASGGALPTVSAPGVRSGGGREVMIGEVNDAAATVETTGIATHFALTDTNNNRLLAAEALSSSQAVSSGNLFTLTSLTIGIPGVV